MIPKYSDYTAISSFHWYKSWGFTCYRKLRNSVLNDARKNYILREYRPILGIGPLLCQRVRSVLAVEVGQYENSWRGLKRQCMQPKFIKPIINHCYNKGSKIYLLYIQYEKSTFSLFSETCSDGLRNQDETGIDCGGVCATPCG